MHDAALRSNVALTCREDVLQPVDIRPVSEREDVRAAAPEGADGELVGTPGAATNVNQDGKPRQPGSEQSCDWVDEPVDEPTGAPESRRGSHPRCCLRLHGVIAGMTRAI